MAVVSNRIDDLDGSSGAETIRFSVGSHRYHIDLSPQNVKRFHEALEPFVQAAKQASVSKSSETALIRAWARDQGYEVSVHGRVSSDLRKRYRAANPSAKSE